MPRMVTSTELKNKTREILDWARLNADDAVIVESYGQPRVAIISYEEYQRLRQEREERRARLFAMIDEVKERTRDVPEAEIDSAIAEAICAVRARR
mgnify:CR=1 FL=1